jgi:endonuclease VIII
MPEGDTVHKLAAALRPFLEGRALASLWLRDRGGVTSHAGVVVEEVAALGKHLLFALGDRDVLHVHLGLHGRWFRETPGDADGMGVVWLETSADRFRCAGAPVAELLRRADLAAHPVLARLGPDLLAADFDPARAVARARHLDARTVADLLLDQRAACGVGNVYKSEVLFAERLHPGTSPTRIDDARLGAVYLRARALMQQNVGGWPRTTVRPVRRGEAWPAGLPRVFVYGRASDPCLRCGARIASRRQGDQARSTYWCPRCQTDHDALRVSGASSPARPRPAAR